MFKSVILSAFILAAGLVSAQANAALMQTDWKLAGDGLSSIDTESGIEWIDITLTRSYSINTILPELAAGGKFYGWRLPTEAEVKSLVTNAFGNHVLDIPTLMDGHLTDIGFTISDVQHFTRTIGGGAYGTVGYLYGGAYFKRDDGKQGVSGFIVHNKTGTYGRYSNPSTATTSNIVPSSYHGVYLVSDGGLTLSSKNNPTLNIKNPNSPINQNPEVSADVPVHAGFGVLGLLLMLFGLRRQVKGAPHA